MKKLLFTLLLAAVTLPGWADDLYIVGDATLLSDAGNSGNTGWAVGSGNRTLTHMTEEPSNVFTWKGLLKKGYFKICNGESGWDGYHPQTANKEIYADGNAQTMTTDNGADYKWQVVIPGIYNVTVNTSENTITITPDWYDISTGDELIAFANYVNAATESNYQGARWARLTADIDMNGKTFPGIGRDNKWQRYHGTFDGQQHKISNLNMTSDYCALVTVAGGGCTIKNLLIDNTCEFNGTGRIAALISACNYTDFGVPVTIENCGNEANVTGTANNCAGLLGCNYSGSIHVTIKNCFNAGNISSTGSESAPISGWTGANATISNTWNIGEIANERSNNSFLRWDGNGSSYTNCFTTLNWGSSISGKTNGYDASKVSTGEFCYELNGDQSSINWYQNITLGTVDSHPVPFSTHNRVYANGEVDCAGHSVGGSTLTYSNSETSTIPPHTFTKPSTGFCSVCGAYEPNALTATDGWYEVSQPWQLRWMAESVTEHNSTYGNANIKLTADIDYSSYTDQAAMFGKSGNTFKGVFDGQCHTVTVAFNNTTDEETGLFRSINGGTVKNLKVAGTINTNQKLAGGICAGIWQKGIIQNCESAVTITDEGSGDATHGGILACVHNKSNTNGGIQVLNCLFSGTLNAPNRTGSGGIIGWPDNAVSEVKVYNCLVTGAITLKDDNDNDLIVRNTADVKNTYYSCTLTNNLRNSKSASLIVSGEIATGEFCFKLNERVSGAENWYQNLPGSVDVLPTPFYTSGKVYANGNFQCDGITPKPGSETTYSNTEGANIDEHSFANHLCTGCKAVGQEPSATDGVYQIEDIGHLIWFAAHVNEGSATASGKLTADITQSDAVYTPIGSSMNPYHGTFDGGYHKVTLNLTDESKDNQGIFGVLTGGATINNIIAAGTVKGYSGVGGIAGSTNGGGNVTFNCCGNEAAVTASHANAGGILGVDMASEATITMKNVYSTGAISGGTDNGGLSGWAGNAPYIINAYCISEVSGNSSSQFIRNNDGTVNFKNTFGNDQIGEGELTNGTLCAKLGFAFRQNIGSGYPCFNQAQGFVAQIGEARYTTMYNIHSDVTIPTGIEAFAGRVNDETVTLLPLTGSIAASEPVILRGNAGLYNFMPTTGASEAATNNLQGSDGSVVTSNDSYYALANLGEPAVVGFYQAENGIVIPEGKAYFVSAANIKGFTFVFDDDATAIEETLSNSPLKGENIYNVAGQRIGKMQRGINIVNGKKIMVK